MDITLWNYDIIVDEQYIWEYFQSRCLDECYSVIKLTTMCSVSYVARVALTLVAAKCINTVVITITVMITNQAFINICSGMILFCIMNIM